jgi:hypothetical protein
MGLTCRPSRDVAAVVTHAAVSVSRGSVRQQPKAIHRLPPLRLPRYDVR